MPKTSGVVGVRSVTTEGDVPSATAMKQLAVRTRQRCAYSGAATYPPVTTAEPAAMCLVTCASPWPAYRLRANIFHSLWRRRYAIDGVSGHTGSWQWPGLRAPVLTMHHATHMP